MSTHKTFSWRNRKNIHLISSLIWSYDLRSGVCVPILFKQLHAKRYCQAFAKYTGHPVRFIICKVLYLGLFCPLRQSTVSIDSVADSEGPDQTAQMHSLISAFTVCKCSKTQI